MEMKPDLIVVWDTSTVSPEDYAEFIGAIDDLVRACGGDGLKRITPPPTTPTPPQPESPSPTDPQAGR